MVLFDCRLREQIIVEQRGALKSDSCSNEDVGRRASYAKVPAELAGGSALYKSIENCDEKIKDLYDRSVRSTKPSNQYRQALLACALAAIDDRGYFSTKSVKKPFSGIMGREMDIPNFARHINEFCLDERGPALIREGRPKAYVFRFSDALLRPFVVIKGINDKLIKQAALK